MLSEYEDGRLLLQDGNHRFEALVKAGVHTYDAFLGKPRRKRPIDSF